jgi:hypothetical protein
VQLTSNPPAKEELLVYVSCKYEHDLVQAQEGWKVTSLKMTPTSQQGNKLVESSVEDAARETAREITNRGTWSEQRRLQI